MSASAAHPFSVDEIRAALAGSRTGGSAGVAVRETHISWVLLTADRAYKLKKPVVLPFLDYGTPERRLEMCREEVRLNRRLAPDVYLGVRALVATADGGIELAAGDDPRAVDYVVEMRRYDERTTVASALRRGELRREDVAELAAVLARFHARAPRVDARGVPALAVERRMTENFHELLSIVEQRGAVERVLALERFAHAFVVAHGQMLHARACGGWIREVHGDLRAEHVLVEGGRVQIVDCVEFDRGLRELDVADDLAFLVMDLAAHGADHVARALVTAYRDAGANPGSDALIAFYAAYRALVRAKVGLVRAAQHPTTSAAHGRESAAARDLLGLAERFVWQARLPLAIVVCGAPASGKSHLAHALAEASGLAHVSSDVTRKRLAGVEPDERAAADVYRAEFNTRTYAELGHRAEQEVAARGGAIIDATFRHRADRDAFAGALGAAAPLVFVECQAPLAVLARRAAQRDKDPARVSDATLAVVERESARWDPLDEVSPHAHVVLRTDRDVETLVAEILGLLDERMGRLGSAQRREIGEPPGVPGPRTTGRGGRAHG